MKKFTKKSTNVIEGVLNKLRSVEDFRLIFSPLTFMLVVVIVFRISYNTGWYNGKNFTIETVNEMQTRNFNMKYDSPEVEKDAEIWRQIGIDNGFWNDKYQERYDNILFYVKESHNMGYSINKNGDKVYPIAYTTFDVIDGELFPDEIVLSDATYFDSTGRAYVLAHEMGHAILLLDDDYSDFSKIMWYQSKDNYANYTNIYFFVEKIKEQYRQKPDKKHLEYLINAVKEYKKIKDVLSIRVYLMSDMEHKIVLVSKDK
ncbi:hypothetical protein BPT24_098 [Tenacibaculum phage pT24]|uniref:Peptidase n=1 Tax=Tenacibaculum phage pT24 TaxID=1880590 RepID=A0A1B4XWM9_9CAUD|nr:hypothetical protein HYP10_gp098 [Tenacibaculum phage pT24]BAV39223.1 hypothetical protein BPT24_098 [Tenacibaculum phage pT24]